MSLLRSTTLSLACILSLSTLAMASGPSALPSQPAADLYSSSVAASPASNSASSSASSPDPAAVSSADLSADLSADPDAIQSPSASNISQQGLSVQARLRARREQRRKAEIHAAYDHLYEAYVGAGFLRTIAGPGVKGDYGGGLQKVNFYSWNVGFTRDYSERWAVTLDGRGYYGTQFLGPNPTNIVKPAISEYAALIGPSYRFLLHPRYSVAGRVMVGAVFNNYFNDANGFTAPLLGLYPDSVAGVLNVSMPIEYNVSQKIALRLTGDYFLSTFSSSIQNGLGLSGEMVYRWGKL